MENTKMNELITYNVSEAAIEEIKKRFLPLEVKNFEDKEGYEQVKKARIEVKTLRVNIEKRRKELKKDSLEFGRMVDGKAKELSAPLEEVEQHLQEQQNVIDAEKKRRKEEAERKERERVEGMFRALVEAGYTNLSMAEVARMHEDEYEKRLQAAAEAKAKREAEEAEQKRKHEMADQRWRALSKVGYNHHSLHDLIEMSEEDFQTTLIKATEEYQRQEEERVERERKMAEQEEENRRLREELEAKEAEEAKRRMQEEEERAAKEEAERREREAAERVEETPEEITAEISFTEEKAEVLLSIGQDDIDALERIYEELDLINAESTASYSKQRYEDLVRLGEVIESLKKMFNLKGETHEAVSENSATAAA